MGRRRFLASSGLTAAAASLPILGCGEHDVDVLSEDVQLLLEDHPELDEVGTTKFVEFDAVALPLAVTRTEADRDAFIVTGTECNHRGCGVERDGEGFECPCHGARFNLDGALRGGPASRDLTPYDYEITDGVMTIFAPS